MLPTRSHLLLIEKQLIIVNLFLLDRNPLSVGLELLDAQYPDLALGLRRNGLVGL
jgi:hypothetical protein